VAIKWHKSDVLKAFQEAMKPAAQPGVNPIQKLMGTLKQKREIKV
jgi:hypothetical protein